MNSDKNTSEQINSSDPDSSNPPADGSTVIPVVEEQLQVGKKTVETGKVHVSKIVREHQELVNIPLISDEVYVERIPINQYVSAPPPPVRYEGNTMIIPVLQEVLVVEKRLLVVEELRITKRQVQTNEQQEVILRKEEVHIERK